MAHRYTLVEHKTLAVPAAGFSRYGFQVFQNAALKVVDLVETLGAQVGRGFLAANAAGAKHGDPGFSVERAALGGLFAHPLGEFRKTGRTRLKARQWAVEGKGGTGEL